MEREKKPKQTTKTPAQEIGFLCLHYCEKLKEELGVPVNGVGMTCLGFCRVIHVDGSGLKMACTTLKGRKTAELTQGIYNSRKYQFFRVFVLQLPGGGSTVSGKILPGDVLGQTYASYFWVDLWLASGFF